MTIKEKEQINFGNWIPVKMIAVPGVLALLCLGLGWVSPWFFIPAAVFLAIALYFAAAWWLFSPQGGNVQERVHQLLIEQLPQSGPTNILDIGCGNGALTLRVAQALPQAHVSGVDYWGKSWDYSVSVCERNARLLGMDDRSGFRQASATALSFDDASFDLVVSNLCFHEVREAADKRAPLREVLRVLKPDGAFVLQDLFLLQSYFGTPEELQEVLRGWGAQEVEFIRTNQADFIPTWVKLPFMLGTLAIVKGVKSAR